MKNLFNPLLSAGLQKITNSINDLIEVSGSTVFQINGLAPEIKLVEGHASGYATRLRRGEDRFQILSDIRVPAVLGKAARFPSAEDPLTLFGGGVITGGAWKDQTKFVACLWFNQTGNARFGNRKLIVADNGANGFRIQGGANDTGDINLWFDGLGISYTDTGIKYIKNAPYFMVFMFDADTDTVEIYLQKSGEQTWQSWIGSGATQASTGTGDIYICRSWFDWQQQGPYDIDEIGFYNTLFDLDRRELYADDGYGRYGQPTDPGLLAGHHFDDETDPTADYSPGGLHPMDLVGTFAFVDGLISTLGAAEEVAAFEVENGVTPGQKGRVKMGVLDGGTYVRGKLFQIGDDTPAINQALMWNSSQWIPGNPDPKIHGNALHSNVFEDTVNRGAASGYCDLDISTLIPASRMGLNNSGALTLLRGDRQYVQPVYGFTFTVESGYTWNNINIPIFQSPKDTTINIIQANIAVMGSGAPCLVCTLEQRSIGFLNTSGTNIMNNQYIRASGVEITSFTSNLVLAKSHVMLKTQSLAASGIVDIVHGVVYFTKNTLI